LNGEAGLSNYVATTAPNISVAHSQPSQRKITLNCSLSSQTSRIGTPTSADRVKLAKPVINHAFADYKQQAFINFVLDKYIEDGLQ
jgi:hypothetical protein